MYILETRLAGFEERKVSGTCLKYTACSRLGQAAITVYFNGQSSLCVNRKEILIFSFFARERSRKIYQAEFDMSGTVSMLSIWSRLEFLSSISKKPPSLGQLTREKERKKSYTSSKLTLGF